MRPRLLLIALVLGGCTSAKSGPELWGEACDQRLRFVEAKPGDREGCVGDFGAFPRAVADDLARCELRRDRDNGRVFDCLNAQTNAYFDTVNDTNEALTRHQKAVLTFEGKNGRVPAKLSELGGEYDGIDAWGRPLVYRVKDDGTHELRSLGYDGELGTEDDLSPPGTFVHFQF